MMPVWQSGFWATVFSRGILFSIFPTMCRLFYVFPYLADKGLMGLALGKLTPVFVFLAMPFGDFAQPFGCIRPRQNFDLNGVKNKGSAFAKAQGENYAKGE